jgi:hypothetical protein
MRTLTRLGIVALITVVFSASVLAQYSQPVRDVENPARTPFWGWNSGTIELNSMNVQLMVGIVPVGQRLVIEHVAVNCATDADDNISLVQITVYKKTGPLSFSGAQVPVVVQKQGTNSGGKGSWTVSQALRLYSDGIASYAHWVTVNHSKLTATAYCFAVVSGYTLSTP